MNDIAFDLERTALIILARLAAGRRAPSSKKLEDELFVFVELHLSRAQWSSRCAERLAALRARGDVDASGAATLPGRARLRQALGVALPTSWPHVWQALVPALALELPASQWSEIKEAKHLRARIIRQRHGLHVPEVPTLRQAVDGHAWQQLAADEDAPLGVGKLKLALMEQALGIPLRSLSEAINAYCWTLLGQPPQVDLSLGAVRRVLLERSLGTAPRGKTVDAAKTGDWLAAEAVGTTKGDIATLRRALVRRWLLAEPPLGPRAAAATTKEAPSEPPSLETWATQVQAVANASDTGRYGDDRVFIATVWKATQAGSVALCSTLDVFKQRLVAANRAGLVRLHRADLVGAMDPSLVRESETQHLTATFHFIETPSRRTA